MSSAVEVKLLGPLDVQVAEGAVQFDGAKQRTLFTALALRAPEPVGVDALVEALWADDPPGDGVQALQKQISRLRRRLGPSAPLNRGASGYALGIEPDAVAGRRARHVHLRGVAVDVVHKQTERAVVAAAAAHVTGDRDGGGVVDRVHRDRDPWDRWHAKYRKQDSSAQFDAEARAS